MSLSSLPIVALLVAIAILVIIRQFQARPVRLLLVIGVPVGLVVLGGRAPLHEPHTLAAFALLAGDVVLALGFGVWRGFSFRVWVTPDGQARRQGTRLTLLLWIVSIASRGVMTAVAHTTEGGRSLTLQELPFLLGLTLLAQGLVLLRRADRLVPVVSAR